MEGIGKDSPNIKIPEIVVCTAGACDPLHLGHIEHFRKAKSLGTKLIHTLNTDGDVYRKRGVVFMPLGQRFELLKAIRYIDEVVLCIDDDGTVARTLRFIRPNIFAKGGDRKPENMPANELEACKDIGCEIVYGIGDILGSSTELLKRFREYDGEIKHNPSGDFK